MIHQPWEQQEKESSKAYAAFITYRDLGFTRTYQQVADIVQKDYSLIRRWAKKWEWAARAISYDGFLLKKDLEAKLQRIKDMNESHETLGSSAEGIVARKIGAELKKIQQNPEYVPPVAWKDLISLLREGTDLRRKALYEGKTRIEVTGSNGGPIQTEEVLTNLTDEELLRRVEAIFSRSKPPQE